MTIDDDNILKEQREEELQVLESIYPDYVSYRAEDCLRLEIPVELGEQATVTLQSEAPLSDATLQLSYLPSILLEVYLPKSYPASNAPAIRSIHATHFWLDRTPDLVRDLDKLWTNENGVLCEWVENIRSGEFLNQMKVRDLSGNICISCTSPQSLEKLLREFDDAYTTARFSSTTYTCSVCFASLKGSHCLPLQCTHVFCRGCLHDYWSLLIKEGSVERVGCPDPSCVKLVREVSEEELRRVVSKEEIQRWKWLRLKKAMEKDPTIVHCPVPTCQAPVSLSSEDAMGTRWEWYRSCSSCGFDFCAFCKHTWHGPVAACSVKDRIELIQRYLALPDSSRERRDMERQFGAASIARLCKDYLEEKATFDLLQNSTTACPGCKVRVEKSEGCNHMTCRRCGMHFCYRCGEIINKENPYAHFNNKKSSCDGQLFDRIREEWEFEPFL